MIYLVAAAVAALGMAGLLAITWVRVTRAIEERDIAIARAEQAEADMEERP